MMKFLTLLLMLCMLLTSCESDRYVSGHARVPCIGAFDDRDPRFIYKLSAWNLFLAIAFIEMIVPPIIVVANETFCPVAAKATQ